MKRICVYCGSSVGKNVAYAHAAKRLGQLLLDREIGLVYGGGHIGLMGEVAKTVYQGGGEVIGVIPKDLFDHEVGYQELKDLRIVNSMHERKALMADLSDAFIALPGGLGTLEEIFEMLTWFQLEIHSKPCGLLNVAGYYNGMIQFLEHAEAEQFIHKNHQQLFVQDEDPDSLLKKLCSYQKSGQSKVEWIKALREKNRYE